MGLGAALAAPEAWPLIAPALLLWAVHHAMAKGALFLGVGVATAKMPGAWSAHLVAAGLLLAALTLAGLPLTTGFAAKAALKAATSAADTWGVQWAGLLPLTSVTTTLLMSRFLWLVWPSRQHGHGPLTWDMVVPWVVLSAGTVVGFAALRGSGLVDAAWLQLDPDAVWSAIWPMGVAGVMLLLVLGSPGSRSALGRIRVPEGDIVLPVAAITRGGRGIGNQVAVVQLPRWFAAVRHTVVQRVVPGLTRLLDRLTRGLENDVAAGLLIALLVVVLFVLSHW
jgi:NADH:ubiquinone oxidoreductase subunit 5 (subunit L)/multisubunit Na+/H+ antiporter MnhA subunit